MLFGTGNSLPDKSGDFAHGVIGLFTDYIGRWSTPIISLAAFSIMFGTCIAVFDGYGRSLERTLILLTNKEEEQSDNNRPYYSSSLIIVIVGAFFVVYFFGVHMKLLVDLATTISFIIAPIIAVVNFRLVGKNFVGEAYVPPIWLRVLSWLGIIFLSGFAVLFLTI